MLQLKQKLTALIGLVKNCNPKILGIVAASLILLVSVPAYFIATRDEQPPKKPASIFTIPPEAYKDLEEKEEGACAGTFQVTNLETDESNYCTHGPEVTFRNAVKRGSEIRVPGSGVQCVGDGTTGMRVQAIYAYAEDKPDRYNELQDYFQRIADNASNSIAASAQKTGGQAQLKWVTNADCEIVIAKVKMRATQDDSFSETINAVQKADHDDPGKIYLIWTEADLVCGLGTFSTDDNPDPNKNINSRGTVSAYSRIDKSCWGESELHEIMHNLGAVQDSAPHSTKRGHCTDGYEVMCYGDGGGKLTGVCEIISHQYLLDCNNDDYFSANPEPGSYLATRWNIFNSNYLATNKTPLPDPADTTPPPKPYNVQVFDVTQDGFKIRWKLPSTEDIDKIQIEVNRAVKVVLRSPATETYSIGSVKPGTTYKARVVTFDKNNNQSASEEVSFTTLTVPTKEPGSIIPHDLKVTSINGSVVTLTAVIDRVPDSTTQYVIWRSTGVGYTSYSFSATDTPKTYQFVDEKVYPQTIVTYHLRVQRQDGSEIARSDEIAFNFTGSHESNPPPAPTGFTLKQYQSGSGYYIQYDVMTDDSGIVHHYGYAVTGPGGYTYNQSDGDEILSPPNLQSGQTYTVTARVFDIWGNPSPQAINNFTVP